MTVYAFEYTDNVHESAMGVISLHKTYEGAQKALEFHKETERKEYEQLHNERFKLDFPFGNFESWRVREIEVHE